MWGCGRLCGRRLRAHRRLFVSSCQVASRKNPLRLFLATVQMDIVIILNTAADGGTELLVAVLLLLLLCLRLNFA